MKSMLSFSGGKNSTAMLLRLKELGQMPDKIIFCDTLMEYPEVYEFIDKVEKHIGQKIIRLKPNNSFLKWFFKEYQKGCRFEGRIHGFPYIRTPCWYQREAKVTPLKKYNDEADVVYIGYAKGEENRKLKDPKFKYPLIEWGWDEQKSEEYCKEKGFLNPLYQKFRRTGCWCCPLQGKKDLKILYKDYPALWRILVQLEELSPHGFQTKYTLGDIEKEVEVENGTI